MRILIVGLGSIGKRHMRVVRALLPDSKIGALRHQAYDPLPDSGADFCFTQIADAIKFSPHVAVISNPATLHLDVAVPLANAGAHLLVEKPISSTSERVEELIELCEVNRITLMIGYNLRFLPSLQKFRSLLSSGRIGKLLSVRAEIGQYLPSWRPDLDYRESVSARKDMGGGALLELSHEIDYLRWIFGEVAWVQAVVRRQSALEIDVEDTAHLVLGFVPDAEDQELIANLNIDFIRHDTTRACAVIGEQGTLRWNGVTGAVDVYEAGTDGWQEIFRYAHHTDCSYRVEWEHFLACIESGERPLVTGRDGLAVLKVVEAARTASATGRLIHLQRLA